MRLPSGSIVIDVTTGGLFSIVILSALAQSDHISESDTLTLAYHTSPFEVASEVTHVKSLNADTCNPSRYHRISVPARSSPSESNHPTTTCNKSSV